MSGRHIIMDFVAEHQSREVELRRLQNCLGAETATEFVGVVDTGWSINEFEAPHFGVVPVSREVRSNWHIGGDVPFVLDHSNNPRLSPKGGEVLDVWVTFKVTSDRGFLLIHPDGDRVFVEWDEKGVSKCGNFTFRAFKTEKEATFWVTGQARQLTDS